MFLLVLTILTGAFILLRRGKVNGLVLIFFLVLLFSDFVYYAITFINMVK